jgi:hypothetical protein
MRNSVGRGLVAAMLWSHLLYAGQPGSSTDQPFSQPLPPEIVKAWGEAGARVQWMRDLPPQPSQVYSFWLPHRDKAEPGAKPAFRFHKTKEDLLAKLPAPGVAFGLENFDCRGVTEAWLKQLAKFKSLQSLNIGGSRALNDAAVKELGGLIQLQGLYLYYTPLTDAGLKELAALKNLQALDLSNTRVTDAGLKHLAGLKSLRALNLGATEVMDAGLKELATLKSLRWLNLRGTKATPTGVAALQKELPACNIVLAVADRD